MKSNLKKSYYIQKLKENMNIIIISFLMALFCTFITYPGVWYSDSYTRVSFADTILDCMRKFFMGQRNSIVASSWLTVIPSFYMAICKFLTGNIATYTFLQATLFFLATFLLIKRLAKHYKKIQYVFWGLNPLIFCVSIYYEASVLCVASIIFYVLLLDKINIKKQKLDNVIEFILLVFFSFTIFGYRANAFTIIPVLVFYVLKMKMNKTKKIASIASLVLGFILVPIFSWILNITTLSSVSAGFVWEVVSTIQEMDETTQKEYIEYLDDVWGESATKIAIEKSSYQSVVPLLNTKITFSNISNKGNFQIILSKYLNLIFKETKFFLIAKQKFIGYNLGIIQPLRYVEYDYDRYNIMEKYNFNDGKRRHQFVDLYEKVVKAFSLITLRPWVTFLLSLILILIKWFKNDENRKKYLLIFMLSLFYYGSYLINTQSFEIRYFYPSLYLCMIIDLSIVIDLIYPLLQNGIYRLKAKIIKTKVIKKCNHSNSLKNDFVHKHYKKYNRKA